MLVRFLTQCIGPGITVGANKLADVPDDIGHWYIDRGYADPAEFVKANEEPVVMSAEYAARFRKAHLEGR